MSIKPLKFGDLGNSAEYQIKHTDNHSNGQTNVLTNEIKC
jgi:hypothetical protein